MSVFHILIAPCPALFPADNLPPNQPSNQADHLYSLISPSSAPAPALTPRFISQLLRFVRPSLGFLHQHYCHP